MPSFNGKHDWTKSLALYCLYKLQVEGENKGLSISEWAQYSNVAYSYINARIPNFWRWGYIRREAKVYRGRPVFAYSLGVEGHKWLRRWVLTVPDRVAELEKRLPKLDGLKALFL